MAGDHRNNNEEHEIRLPSKLLEQIQQREDRGDYNEDNSRFTKFENTKKRKEKPVSRKEKRQQERQTKKQKRIQGNESRKQKEPQQNGKKGSKVNTSNSAKPVQAQPTKPVKKHTEEEDPLAALAALKNKKSKKEDPLAQLAALKAKKNKSKEEDPLAQLAALKAKKNKKNDPMAELAALKAAKGSKSSEIRIVKEDDLDDFEDEDDLGDFDGFEEEDLEGLEDDEDGEVDQESEESGEENEDDEDGEEEDFSDLGEEDDFEDFGDSENEELEEEEDPLAKLKALKEAKKNKEQAKKKEPVMITSQEQDLFRKDDDDIEYYAKKLGLKNGKKSKLSKTDDDDIIGGLLDGIFSGDEDEQDLSEIGEEDEDSDLGSDFDEEEDPESKPKRENPYVAPVESEDEESDNSGEESTKKEKYIPPALRRKMAMESGESSEEIVNLRRAIKGPLNRLSEANINTIVNEINGLYLSNARHFVNEQLTNLILDSIIQQGRLLDTFVYLHATLVAAIYRLQGVEFGAHFIQTLLEKFEASYKNAGSSKEASNLISLLSSVYLFSLVTSKLLYDIIKLLIGDLNETNAELLLRLIRSSGNQMRSDDPTALKEIVLLINQVAQNLTKDQLNTRTQFLIETITSLKNNKLKVSNEANHSLSIRLKKFLGSVNNNKFSDPIQVSLDDIHNIATRGKWWLVGSAWKGVDASNNADEPLANEMAIDDILDNAEPNWMELARSQRMNTNIRRAIFISIMSATDYIDAMTKIDKLALKRSQEREIPRVLIHCTGVEPAWNPYYGILANKMCENHSFRKTFQFMLWDILKEFEGGSNDDSEEEDDFLGFEDGDQDDETNLKRVLNLGRFFGFLLAEGSLPLHILRPVNFVTASSNTVLFLEVLFVTFLDQIGKKSQANSVGGGLGKKSTKMYEQKYDERLLIERTLKAQEQPTLLRGIGFFLKDKVVKSDIISGKKQRKRVEWGVEAWSDIIEEFLKGKEDYDS